MKLGILLNPKPTAALALIALASLITLALLADDRSASAQTQGPTFTFPPDMPQDRQDAYRNYFAALSAFSQTRFGASPDTDDLTITIYADELTCGVGQAVNSIILYEGCLDESGRLASWGISNFIGELYFHTLWDSWFFTEIPDWTNDWVVDGAATYFAYLWVDHYHEVPNYNDFRSDHIQGVSEFDPAPLSQINPFDPAEGLLAFLAIDYLAEQTGATKPIDYFTAARNSSPAGFAEHFQNVFGISSDAFYDYFAAHRAAGFPQPGAPFGSTPTHTPVPTSTRTPIATPTYTPVATPTRGQIDNRVSQLEGQVSALRNTISSQRTQIGTMEQLAATLQSLINRLTGRIDALESSTPQPTATPASTPTATPSPTPTSVPGADPTPVTNNACMQPIERDALIAGGTTIAGTWTTDCLTANPDPNDPTITFYAKFYTFILDAQAEFELSIDSDHYPYIYMTSGAGTDGETFYASPIWSREQLQILLQPGSYTLEVTTYQPNVTGDFNLWMVLRTDTGH